MLAIVHTLLGIDDGHVVPSMCDDSKQLHTTYWASAMSYVALNPRIQGSTASSSRGQTLNPGVLALTPMNHASPVNDYALVSVP